MFHGLVLLNYRWLVGVAGQPALMPKIQKGTYFRKARTAANSHLGMLARESYGATKDSLQSFRNQWDDFSRLKFALRAWVISICG